jgi:hypothetical protein
MAERKTFNFTSEILKDLTIEREGYDPESFGKTSTKHVWATCRFCGKPSRITKGNFNKIGSACHKECKLEQQRQQKSPFLDPAVREKAKQTTLDRYGFEHASQNRIIAKRISASRLTKESQDKIKATNMERYGVENPFQSETIKAAIKQTNLERYGYDHAMKDAARVSRALEKFAETVEIDENEQYKLINLLRTEIFWNQLGTDGETLQSVADTFGVKYNSLTATLIREEFKEKYYQTYSFPKYQAQRKMVESISYSGLIEQNTRQIISPQELDVYFPDKKFAIEFNGSHWHSEAILSPKEARNRQYRKTLACRIQGIRLFHIFEHHWIDRQLQILNFIKTILGQNKERLMARNCTLTNDICLDFIEKNHIQGLKANHNILQYFNLVIDGKIVASMTASKHHRQTEDGIVVLSRLCFADGVSVAGGASKLFKAFRDWAKISGFSRIISWSDNCWTEGDIYRLLGFTLSDESKPDYFYWDMRNKRYRSKQSQRKTVTGCPENLKEREWCVQRGLYRIWDCGKKRWEFQL